LQQSGDGLPLGWRPRDGVAWLLLAEPTLAQRLVRAKRKIAEAGVSFEVRGPEVWADGLDAVLSTSRSPTPRP
jgi:predicted RNA polymerase sigma factor